MSYRVDYCGGLMGCLDDIKEMLADTSSVTAYMYSSLAGIQQYPNPLEEQKGMSAGEAEDFRVRQFYDSVKEVALAMDQSIWPDRDEFIKTGKVTFYDDMTPHQAHAMIAPVRIFSERPMSIPVFQKYKEHGVMGAFILCHVVLYDNFRKEMGEGCPYAFEEGWHQSMFPSMVGNTVTSLRSPMHIRRVAAMHPFLWPLIKHKWESDKELQGSYVIGEIPSQLVDIVRVQLPTSGRQPMVSNTSGSSECTDDTLIQLTKMYQYWHDLIVSSGIIYLEQQERAA